MNLCAVCQNSESLRDARLKLETDLIVDKLGNIECIKTNISNNISQFEDIDLHLQYLLLDKSKFDNYQTLICQEEDIEDADRYLQTVKYYY